MSAGQPTGSPRAGEVYRVTLAGEGHEQRGHRPVVVVQDDDALPLSTRLCVPTSTSAESSAWRIPVQVEGEETMALVEQLRAISNHRLERFVGTIGPGALAEIRTVASRLLGVEL